MSTLTYLVIIRLTCDQSALSIWRDGPSLAANNSESDEPIEEGAEGAQGAAAATSSTPAPPSRPADDDADDWDQQLLRGASSRTDDGYSTSTSRSSSVQPPPTSEDDTSAAEWAAKDATERASNVPKATNADFDMDDEDEWDQADSSEAAPIIYGRDDPATSAPPATSQAFPEDTDMFDVFDDEPDPPPVVLDSLVEQREHAPGSDKHIAPTTAKVPEHDAMGKFTQEELDEMMDEFEMYS